jgi:hypothetical protein
MTTVRKVSGGTTTAMDDERERPAGDSGEPTVEAVVERAAAVATTIAGLQSAADNETPRHLEPDDAQLLGALALLRQVRDDLNRWEPTLIGAARERGVSWADLARPLGVNSRQAAERRYLRIRPAPDGQPSTATGEQRVRAERDRRAAERAVAAWARTHAGQLRQLAGQVSAVDDLDATIRARFRRALGRSDTTDLLAPLEAARRHLRNRHPGLAGQIEVVTGQLAQIRSADRGRRTDR